MPKMTLELLPLTHFDGIRIDDTTGELNEAPISQWNQPLGDLADLGGIDITAIALSIKAPRTNIAGTCTLKLMTASELTPHRDAWKELMSFTLTSNYYQVEHDYWTKAGAANQTSIFPLNYLRLVLSDTTFTDDLSIAVDAVIAYQ